MNPQWQDIALLGYIAIFGILTAVLILKEERLGWAMFAVKMSYAVAFGYGALMLAMPKLASEDARRGIRVLLAVSSPGPSTNWYRFGSDAGGRRAGHDMPKPA